MSNKQVTFSQLLDLEDKVKDSKTTKTSTKASSKSKTMEPKADSKVGIKNNKVNSKNNSKPIDTKTSTTTKINTKIKKGESVINKGVPIKETKKNSRTKKSQKVSFTSDEMDKLCEVYDWYLVVKDKIDILSNSTNEDINIFTEPNKIDKVKKVSISVEESIWEDFSRLCQNTNSKKGELLSSILKKYLVDNSDLI